MTKQERIAHKQKMDAIRAQVQAVVNAGHCPQCGSKLRRNLSLTGWWQCEQFGSDQFRARPHDKPCNWQGFTE